MRTDYFEKVKNYNIIGRGGAEFPAWRKWETAMNTEADKKYLICNSSEGELALCKDLYVWRNHMDLVFEGMRYAMDAIGARNCYININEEYYRELQCQLYRYINDYKWTEYSFEIFIEKTSYIGGEASTILNAIENGKNQPRFRRFRTSQKGLFLKPTVVQNVETLHDIALAVRDEYDQKRFYSLCGDGLEKKIVIRAPNDATIDEIMSLAKVKPDFDFFVVIGGSASGKTLNSSQLADNKMIGGGSIEIFEKAKWPLDRFLERLFDFYYRESCLKCTPCREGSAKLLKMVRDAKSHSELDREVVVSICDLMKNTAFCGLGQGIYQPVKTYMDNVLG